ncbi:hypothetical protein HDE_06098 [Halotydeus destructor]|nr:hypothetical protein HDE_06098 [Halotydeus destructor]
MKTPLIQLKSSVLSICSSNMRSYNMSDKEQKKYYQRHFVCASVAIVILGAIGIGLAFVNWEAEEKQDGKQVITMNMNVTIDESRGIQLVVGDGQEVKPDTMEPKEPETDVQPPFANADVPLTKEEQEIVDQAPKNMDQAMDHVSAMMDSVDPLSVFAFDHMPQDGRTVEFDMEVEAEEDGRAFQDVLGTLFTALSQGQGLPFGPRGHMVAILTRQTIDTEDGHEVMVDQLMDKVDQDLSAIVGLQTRSDELLTKIGKIQNRLDKEPESKMAADKNKMESLMTEEDEKLSKISELEQKSETLLEKIGKIMAADNAEHQLEQMVKVTGDPMDAAMTAADLKIDQIIKEEEKEKKLLDKIGQESRHLATDKQMKNRDTLIKKMDAMIETADKKLQELDQLKVKADDMMGKIGQVMAGQAAEQELKEKMAAGQLNSFGTFYQVAPPSDDFEQTMETRIEPILEAINDSDRNMDMVPGKLVRKVDQEHRRSHSPDLADLRRSMVLLAPPRAFAGQPGFTAQLVGDQESAILAAGKWVPFDDSEDDPIEVNIRTDDTTPKGFQGRSETMEQRHDDAKFVVLENDYYTDILSDDDGHHVTKKDLPDKSQGQSRDPEPVAVVSPFKGLLQRMSKMFNSN